MPSFPTNDANGVIGGKVGEWLENKAWKRTADALRILKSDVEGLADATPVLRAASDFALNNGIRRLYLPAATMNIQTRWYIDARNKGALEVIGHGEDTVFRVNAPTQLAVIHALGTDEAKAAMAADIPAGSTSATFPAAVASTLAKGDCIGFESTRYVFDVNNEAGMRGYASEIRKVAAVSGATVTFDGPTIWPYNVAENAVVWKMNPVNGLTLRDFVITNTAPTTYRWKGIQVGKATNLVVSNVTFREASGGLYLYDVIDGVASGINADRLPNYTNYSGYGVCVAGRSANILVDRPRGRGTRHIFTTLSDERNGVHWGGPRHVTVRDGVGEAHPGSFAVWDTHPHGYDVTFENCHASGGVAGQGDSCGFQVRSLNTQIINGVARNMGAAGIRMHTMAENLDIVGGEYAWGKDFGVSLSKNGRINGAWIHHNGATAVVLTAKCAGARVMNCKLDDNGQLTSGRGVHDQSTGDQSGVVVGPGNIIPKSTTQDISVLSPKNDAVIYGNVMRGFGAGATGVYTPAETVVQVQNITDSGPADGDIATSPNGTRYRLGVADDGSLTTTSL